MLVFFLKISAVTYTTGCARVRFCFWKASAQRFAIFSLRSCTACARVLSLCMLARRARGAARDDGLAAISATRRQRRKVDKCRVADKKQTNQQTNKHTLLFYRYRYMRPQCTNETKREYYTSACSKGIRQVNAYKIVDFGSSKHPKQPDYAVFLRIEQFCESQCENWKVPNYAENYASIFGKWL